MRAAALLVGPDRGHREVGVLLELAAEVVGVGQADVAGALGDRVEHVDVRPQDLGVVVHPAPQHLLGGLRAVLGEPVGDERDVVLAGARAQAQPALPAWIAKVLVGRCVLGPDPLGRAHDRPGAGREAEPRPLGVAHVGRHVAAQHGGVDRLEQPLVVGAPEVGGVGGDQDVGAGALSLAPEALVELGSGPARERQVVALVLGEALEGLLLAVVRACGEDHQLVLGGARGGEHDPHEGGGQQRRTPAEEDDQSRACGHFR